MVARYTNKETIWRHSDDTNQCEQIAARLWPYLA